MYKFSWRAKWTGYPERHSKSIVERYWCWQNRSGFIYVKTIPFSLRNNLFIEVLNCEDTFVTFIDISLWIFFFCFFTSTWFFSYNIQWHVFYLFIFIFYFFIKLSFNFRYENWEWKQPASQLENSSKNGWYLLPAAALEGEEWPFHPWQRTKPKFSLFTHLERKDRESFSKLTTPCPAPLSFSSQLHKMKTPINGFYYFNPEIIFTLFFFVSNLYLIIKIAYAKLKNLF